MSTRYQIYSTKDFAVADITSKQPKLTVVTKKTSTYAANAWEYVPCDVSGGGFTVTLPTAPADGTIVQVTLVKVTAPNELIIATGGSDVLNDVGGNTSTQMRLKSETLMLTYQASVAVWRGLPSAATSNFAINFPGIDASTPITNANIAIDTSSRVLTITPPLGYFNFFVDGGGTAVKYRKTGAVNFPAFTDTSGIWYFYFNSAGTAVTTQTPWTTADFPNIATVYRLLWNATLFKFTVAAATATMGDTYTNNSSTFTVLQTISGGTTLICSRTSGTNNPAASGNLARATGSGTNPIVFSAFSEDVKSVAEYIEYHLNDISADTHQWFHLQGAQWVNGFTMVNNALVSGTPAADGSNTVIALTSGSNVDDNLEYSITNDTSGTAWHQDLGNTTPASLNATNSALFSIFTQDAGGLVTFLPATRFPFAWNATSNRPEIISATGTRTVVTDNRWFVYFVYSTQNPRTGEALKSISATSEFTSLANAQAYNWIDIQNTYPTLFGNDGELRPLYRIVFYNDNSGAGAYPAGAKYSVIRETQDLRKSAVTSTTAATGTLPSSSVTVVPTGNIASTNVQSALVELDSAITHWSIATADGNLAVNTGTLANKGSLLTLTLPTGAAVGTTIRVAGMNAGLWKIAQNANQYIKFGNQTTTTGVTGYLASVLTYDAVELVCIVADTGFVVASSVGNITVA